MTTWFYPGQEDYITKLNELGAIAELVSGPDGWSPVLAVVSDGERRVLQIAEWVGGETAKPATGGYIGSTGIVGIVALAVDIRGPQGTSGSAGPSNVLSIGTVTGGVTASATITGTSPSQALNLVLPKGDPGEPGTDGNDGAAATIAVGTVTTVSPGSSATVTNVGTSSAAVFDFSIPKGADGAGSGDVVGPASSVNNGVALFDGLTGNLLKDGGVLGTAAFSATTDYATSAQGTLADTAVQPSDLATVATTGAYSDLSGKPTIGTSAALNVASTGNAAVEEVVKGDDTRLTDSRSPSGAAGGVLSGSYPNPGFAVDMATQAELDAVSAVANAKLSDAPSDGKTYGRKNAAWAEVTGGSTPEVVQPINVAPSDAITTSEPTPTLVGSAFYSLYSAPQSAVQLQISTVADFTTLTYDSGDLAPAISVTVPPATLVVSTTYYWRLRYKNTLNTYSEWSDATSFTTAAVFNSFIPTPSATPSNFGDAFEGGFYVGMIWNEVVQATNSVTIGTGTKTFTVPDMTGAPLFYLGQVVEARITYSPTQKMVGTVIGAIGTTVTLDVTSAISSGTDSAWSLMAQYRVIVAPKSSGENSSITIKNAATGLPGESSTYTEGYRSTQGMVAAGNSTVYPAAHWAIGRTIGGYSDWYVPSRDEAVLFQWNLKPITTNNATVVRPVGLNFGGIRGAYADPSPAVHGENLNSIPNYPRFTSTVPARTALTAFQTGGTEVLPATCWTSSEFSTTNNWLQTIGNGAQSGGTKNTNGSLRVVRRSII